ncbi:MAG: hypothetical protein IT379_39695 [Deltaproteobacteria bacterium]|nr:hypothetical protein [Deltaproteobacteria bacterium]
MRLLLTSDSVLSQRAYAFRKTLFSRKYGTDFPEDDGAWTHDTTWILAFDETESIVGTTRLLHDRRSRGSAFSLRASSVMRLPLPDHECLEIATVSVASQLGGATVLRAMWSLIPGFCYSRGLTYVCGIVDADFFSQLSRKRGTGGSICIAMSDARVALTVAAGPLYVPEYGIVRYAVGGYVEPVSAGAMAA